jgi:hypothetical protein
MQGIRQGKERVRTMELITVTERLKFVGQGVLALALVFLLTGNNIFVLPQRVKGFSYSILREIAKYQFLYRTSHLEQMESEHFVVRFTNPDREMAQLVLNNAEAIYQPVQDKLGIEHKKKVLVGLLMKVLWEFIGPELSASFRPESGSTLLI